MPKGFSNIISLCSLLKNEREVNHCKRVADYGWYLGMLLDFPYKKRLLLYYLCLYHDVGKWKIDNKILDKKGLLSESEKKIMRMHPIYSEQVTLSMNELRAYAHITRAHHERWDGQGYPDGFMEDNIPFMSRIISILDVYDALTNERPYRKNIYTTKEALEIIMNGSGLQFDPKLTKLFVKNINYIVNPYREIKKTMVN